VDAAYLPGADAHPRDQTTALILETIMQEVVTESPRVLPQPGTARFDLYTAVHKGLRAAMSDTLLAVGRLDWADPDEVAEVLATVRTLLAMCRDHLEHEERRVHTAMEERCPGSSAQTAADHRDHRAAFVALEADIRAVERASTERRAAEALRLYRQLAVFIGENFLHMHTEEVENTAILWQTFTDADLAGIHQAIVGSIAPEQMAIHMRWMVPSLSPAERAALLNGMQQKAPAPVFEGMLAAVRPHLGCADWAKLMTALGRSQN
jgi:hypothetical protein